MCVSIVVLVAIKKKVSLSSGFSNMVACVCAVFSLVEHVVWFALGTRRSIEARGHSKDRRLFATGVGVESHTHVVFTTFALVLLAHANASKDEDEDELGAPDPSHG